MTSRELLELAAKTAGHSVRWHEDSYYGPTMEVMEDESGGPPWNPLTDDGDSFRLLAAMQASLEFDGLYVRVQCEGPAGAPRIVVSERIEPGPTEDEGHRAAMRRAVTKAAAVQSEMGSEMSIEEQREHFLEYERRALNDMNIEKHSELIYRHNGEFVSASLQMRFEVWQAAYARYNS